MRNRFAHGYMNMKYEVIYKTAINDIPILSNFIDSELKKMNNDIDTNNDSK